MSFTRPTAAQLRNTNGRQRKLSPRPLIKTTTIIAPAAQSAIERFKDSGIVPFRPQAAQQF